MIKNLTLFLEDSEESTAIYSGFIYIWYDTKRKKFYIGSHKGHVDDGYTGSNKRFKCAYKSRPLTFKRKILEIVEFTNHSELLRREQYWLNLIKPEELCNKYYNEKKVAAGGNIVSLLTEERKNQHREKSIAARVAGRKKWVLNNKELVSRIAKKARASVKNPFSIADAGKIKLLERAQADAFMTPLGPRPFLTKAAKEFGIGYKQLKRKVDNNQDGFYWLSKNNYFYA